LTWARNVGGGGGSGLGVGVAAVELAGVALGFVKPSVSCATCIGGYGSLLVVGREASRRVRVARQRRNTKLCEKEIGKEEISIM
jgi:hypothetical protein